MNVTVKTPWHLWVIGVVSLLWNAFPALDFTLTNLQNDFWLSPLTQPQREFILSAPLWADACWALGGFGSFVGSILLLMRSRHAVTAFLLSAVGLAGSAYYQLVQNAEAMQRLFAGLPFYITAAVAVVLLGLILYARAMAAKGVLR